MKLANKYNIPQETIDKMIKDGVMACHWPRYEKIYEAYATAMKVPGAVKSRVILDIAVKEGLSESLIRQKIIPKFE